jgi:phosphoribosylanthranilate isomerase
MPLLVKICGLKTPDALDAALEAGADMVGFVFFPPSPRNLGTEAARPLGERVKGRAKKVALSVDATDAELDRAVEALKPDMLQLHGKETPERVVAVRSRFVLPFDGRAPCEATRPGGLGKTFDWSLLEKIDPGVPFMLSGGLDAGNVAKALRITRAPAVDVSSGVERAPGDKDPDKIRAFIRAARVADNAQTAKLASTA